MAEPCVQHSFIDARTQLHHAVQLLAAPANTLLPRRPDHHNRNLGWSSRDSMILGRPIGVLQAGLRMQGPAWVLLSQGRVVAEQGVVGSSLAEGLAWLQHSWVQAGGREATFELPGYELPDHAVAGGAPFGPIDATALDRLVQLWDQSDRSLQRAAATFGGDPVRLWPHHLDLATLIVVSGDGEDMRSVGISYTPGDISIPRPYISVSPWPYPDAEDLMDLPCGRWHTEGFTAAVIQADDDGVDSFLDRVVPAVIQAVTP